MKKITKLSRGALQVAKYDGIFTDLVQPGDPAPKKTTSSAPSSSQSSTGGGGFGVGVYATVFLVAALAYGVWTYTNTQKDS